MENQIVKCENHSFVITSVIANEKQLQFSFRTYDTLNECGGYETTIRIAGGISKDLIPMFCSLFPKSTIKNLGLKIIFFKTNNTVPVCYRFQRMRDKL